MPSFREAFRQLAERLFARNASDARRARLRAAAAADRRHSRLRSRPARALAGLAAHPSLRQPRRRSTRGRRWPWWRSPTASPRSPPISAVAALVWGFADAAMAQPRTLAQIRQGAESEAAIGASSISPTSTWSASVMASASRAAGRARAAMSGSSACSTQLEAIDAKDQLDTDPDHRRHDRRRHFDRMGRSARRARRASLASTGAC